MRIAIMQPYFIPYAGYFRLLQSTDLFVAYDCVQHIRRGWIHRNKLNNFQGEQTWLTLPLAKAAQDTSISELNFSKDASQQMQEQMKKFPLFNKPAYIDSEFCKLINTLSQPPVTHIIDLLKLTCHTLQIPCNIVRSSTLNLSSAIKGQERIIAITKHFQATTYINAPGGRQMYDAAAFKKHNIELQFLSDYIGNTNSILDRIFNENITNLRNEIISQSIGT